MAKEPAKSLAIVSDWEITEKFMHDAPAGSSPILALFVPPSPTVERTLLVNR